MILFLFFSMVYGLVTRRHMAKLQYRVKREHGLHGGSAKAWANPQLQGPMTIYGQGFREDMARSIREGSMDNDRPTFIEKERYLGLPPEVLEEAVHRRRAKLAPPPKRPDIVVKGGQMKDYGHVIKHKGSLGIFGYKNIGKLSADQRHAALAKALSSIGKGELDRKLTAIAVLNKHKPIGKVMRADLHWVESQ